ncbi:MAG: GlsB/YeaQ/YmgE family stress response membrane protein [Phenylobacterium sp.]|uniref:GlsB/YeaQ/YmgE family stress response membrane protein n=1 Tax=Phenylobacterium sp. TaxID=1871053 RepID=UPI001A5B7ADA|nr:GlsB/YeaQ/YmgE family stress response membrane protein [Phenylobacterium sp.]MBL8554769.1 GlsB/YeaQ/YmgE family stress response membrane protein [Phenylobacterium sp.]
MSGVGIIGAILIGILAGWIAEKVMRRNHGLLTNLVVGVIGAFLGSFIATTLGIGLGSGVVPSLVVATAGAILLLFLFGLFQRRRRTF